MPCKNPDLAASGTGSVPVAAWPERSGSSLGSLPVPGSFKFKFDLRPASRPGRLIAQGLGARDTGATACHWQY